jgi:hypothetical protein
MAKDVNVVKGGGVANREAKRPIGFEPHGSKHGRRFERL